MARDSSAQMPSGRGVNRWLRFGPGLVLAVAAIAALWPHLKPLRPQPPPAQPAAAAVAAAPDLDWLLKQEQTLHFTSKQKKRLEQLRNRWNQDTLPLRDQLDREIARFQQQMPTSGAGMSLGEIQARAEPISLLSGQLAAARRKYWGEAAHWLTPEQHRQAEAAWNARLQGHSRPNSL